MKTKIVLCSITSAKEHAFKFTTCAVVVLLNTVCEVTVYLKQGHYDGNEQIKISKSKLELDSNR